MPATTQELAPLLSPLQAALAARCSVGSIKNWIAAGKLSAVKTACGWLIDPQSLEAFLAERAVSGKPGPDAAR